VVSGRAWTAGRFERMTLSHWFAASPASTFQIPTGQAASDVVHFGSYPGAVSLLKDLERCRAYI